MDHHEHAHPHTRRIFGYCAVLFIRILNYLRYVEIIQTSSNVIGKRNKMIKKSQSHSKNLSHSIRICKQTVAVNGWERRRKKRTTNWPKYSTEKPYTFIVQLQMVMWGKRQPGKQLVSYEQSGCLFRHFETESIPSMWFAFAIFDRKFRSVIETIALWSGWNERNIIFLSCLPGHEQWPTLICLLSPCQYSEHNFKIKHFHFLYFAKHTKILSF